MPWCGTRSSLKIPDCVRLRHNRTNKNGKFHTVATGNRVNDDGTCTYACDEIRFELDLPSGDQHAMCKVRSRALLLLAVIALVGVGYQWHRWTTTRHIRNLRDAVADSPLDSETKAVFEKLIWLPEAWKGGLIRDLMGSSSLKRLVWKGKTHSLQDIYIFDGFIRPIAGTPIPPVCVVLNREGELWAWSPIAPYSLGFLGATIDDQNMLTITTTANWFFGKGTYQYAIGDRSITPLGDAVFVKFEEDFLRAELPQLTPSISQIEAAAKSAPTAMQSR